MNKLRVMLFALTFHLTGLLCCTDILAQGVGVSPNAVSPHPSALLDVNSTSAPYKGTLITRLTTAQRNSIAAPPQALTIYNTDTKCFEYYESGSWRTMSCAICPTPSQPSVISGNAEICVNTNGLAYSVTNVPGLTYSWTYSGSGFSCATGCSTNAITANFSGAATSGILTCTPSNGCGPGVARTFSVTVISGTPAQPSVITGTTPVCQTATGVAYSVTNVAGVTYNWTYSGTGFTCSSGCTTNSITANFSSATSGTLTCTPSNTCGAGSPRTFSVTATVPPNTSNAGPDQLNLAGTSATLAGNAASPGTGSWSIISGAGGSVTTPASPTSAFTGTAGTSYVLRWTISNSPCTASFDEVTISFAAPVCTIGASVGGGKAFLFSGGKCYIAPAADQSAGAAWGSSVLVGAGAQGQAVGTGQANTTAIVNAGAAFAGSATKICDDLVSGGFSDWYLPSINELSAMFGQNGALGLNMSGVYRSSSEHDASIAWMLWTLNGVAYNLWAKSETNRQVRCIRSF